MLTKQRMQSNGCEADWRSHVLFPGTMFYFFRLTIIFLSQDISIRLRISWNAATITWVLESFIINGIIIKDYLLLKNLHNLSTHKAQSRKSSLQLSRSVKIAIGIVTYDTIQPLSLQTALKLKFLGIKIKSQTSGMLVNIAVVELTHTTGLDFQLLSVHIL